MAMLQLSLSNGQLSKASRSRPYFSHILVTKFSPKRALLSLKWSTENSADAKETDTFPNPFRRGNIPHRKCSAFYTYAVEINAAGNRA